jgi:hypothetical protein
LSSELEGETVLKFDGDLIIVNNGQVDQHVTLSSASHRSPYTTKKAMIRKGEKYVVVHHHFKEEEVILLNVKDKDSISPILRGKLQNALASI